MASYKSLKQVFHQTSTHADQAVREELAARHANPATLHYAYDVGDSSIFVLPHRAFQVVQEQIWQRELTIEYLWGQLPGVARRQYLFNLLVDEIRSSNEIENIHSTRQEIAEALRAVEKKTTAGSSIPRKQLEEMAKTYKVLFAEREVVANEFPKTLEELRSLYDQLLDDAISDEDRLDGELFRNGPVVIEDGNNDPIHRGITGEDQIKARLQTVLEIQQEGQPHGLINLFIGHFMLEHTHPFYDGNGRFGRFLMALRLRALLSAPTAISLSAEILRQKTKYYKAFTTLEDARIKGEGTFFVSDMMDILRNAQDTMISSLHEKLHQLQQLSERVLQLKQGNKLNLGSHHIQVLFLLGQALLFGPRSGVTLDECLQFTARARGTIRPVMKELVKHGLVIELSKKPLVFALTDEGQDFLLVETTATTM